MATATATRHPGRRKPASPNVIAKHEKLITQAEKKRRKLETDTNSAMTTLAERIDKAMQDGVPTNVIAKNLGISRQMVYKLVRERVDGRPLGNAKKGPSQNGAKAS
jgi:DNA invertase Pin-like site-specific DNA recombinase